MIHFVKEKLSALSYRLELISECNRLIKSGKNLPKNYKKLMFRQPSRYDDFIQCLCFVNNNNTINLIDIGTNEGNFIKDLFFANVFFFFHTLAMVRVQI